LQIVGHDITSANEALHFIHLDQWRAKW